MWLLAWLGCAAIHPLDGQEICDEVGYGVAARTLACTDDAALANARFEAYRDQLTCTIQDPERAPVDKYLTCAAAVNNVSCDAVERYGDDVVSLVASASPHCSRMFAEIEGAVKPEGWTPTGPGRTQLSVDLFGSLRCPVATLGDPVTILVNNPRSAGVAVMAVDLPCNEVGTAVVVPAASTAPVALPAGSVLRIRTLEGALLHDDWAMTDGSVEVAP